MQETAQEDAKKVLEELGKSSGFESRALPEAYKKDKSGLVRAGNSKGDVEQTSDIEKRVLQIQEYFRSYVPRHVVMQIYKHYYWDFQLFGYTIDGFV